MDAYRDTLRRINPVTSMGPDQFEAFLAEATERTFSKGECIYLQGDTDDQIYFLVEGTLHRKSEGSPVRPLTAGEDGALFALGNLQPRPHTAQISSDTAVVVAALRDRVEELAARSQMVTGEMPALSVTDVASSEGLDGSWMFQVVQSEIFRELPTENIERFFESVERVEAPEGVDVVTQGEEGDYYYMIANGQAEVRRMAGRHPIPIATLGPGDSFGEEALISGLPRNATVTMLEDGVLMRLSKDRFESLLIKPVVEALEPKAAARALKEDGTRLIDVRLENEHGSRAIRGSENIPLFKLREAVEDLDKETRYIVYCDSGARSSAAAFLLSQHGLDACFIRGGLSAMIG
ncbi:MAG: cyclic nucleotide-binding domain-containing protein [Pseudomonadota bacterium]